jgi:hypothetical protein
MATLLSEMDLKRGREVSPLLGRRWQKIPHLPQYATPKRITAPDARPPGEK